MIIKVQTELFIEVRNDTQGEEACNLIQLHLADSINESGFPGGTVEKVDVKVFTEATEEELEEQGLVE